MLKGAKHAINRYRGIFVIYFDLFDTKSAQKTLF